ncbi:MAG: glycerol-3-phosphate dehydrogenase/oxidase [Gaiellales bacterium]
MTPGGRRDDALERLAGASVDLLVIGAGAIGAATAWHAARAGATVAVVDRGDIAGATSGASSKLLHGGLRYLAMGDLHLVREAHRERRANADVVAPHLVRPLEFIVPVGSDSPVALWRVRAGVFLYAALSRFADGRSGRIPVATARQRVPGLAVSDLRGTVLYHDHQTNDARLTLAALQGAAAAGALVATHAEVAALRIANGRAAGAEIVDRLSGRGFTVSARAVVNATGPWVDHVRRLESPGAADSVRLAKGAHLVLAGGEDWGAAVTTPLPQGRVSFAIPWEGMLLLGTTDEPYDGDPAEVRATPQDEAQILAEAGRSLVPEVLSPQRVRSSFAGLRVLPLSGGSTSRTRRETVITRGAAGMISVAGGKLTTWRLIGAEAASLALADLGIASPDGRPAPLPGAAPLQKVEDAIARAHGDLPVRVRRHLAGHYGMLALDVLATAAHDPGLLEPIRPEGPDIWAQVVHAHEHEWAATVDDVASGRTTLHVRGLDDDRARDRIGRMLAAGAPA